jgi:NAD-dependent dihydropyrimidine dehydrogenase PreA subunit
MKVVTYHHRATCTEKWGIQTTASSRMEACGMCHQFHHDGVLWFEYFATRLNAWILFDSAMCHGCALNCARAHDAIRVARPHSQGSQ